MVQPLIAKRMKSLLHDPSDEEEDTPIKTKTGDLEAHGSNFNDTIQNQKDTKLNNLKSKALGKFHEIKVKQEQKKEAKKILKEQKEREKEYNMALLGDEALKKKDIMGGIKKYR